MIFPIKSEAEMLQEMIDEVVLKTGVTNMTPGSIARSLLEVFNRRLNACYKYLDMYLSMTFLSSAKDMYLDMIGRMLGCERLSIMESDTNYRYRISQQVFTTAAANRTSVRLKCLSVAGVKNIVMTPYSRGNGSFTIHVVSDEIDTPADILAQVEAVVADVKAEGIRAIVAKPSVVPIDIKFNIVKRTGSTVSETAIGSQIKAAIGDYVDTIPMGGTISISEMLRIAQSNQSVSQAYVNSLNIDGEAAIANNQYGLEWDERAYVNSVVAVE